MNKTGYLLLCLMGLMMHSVLWAQDYRRGNSLTNAYGSSASGLDQGRRDRNGNPIDTTAVVDANTIPIGIKTWHIDSRFGNVKPIVVDTLMYGFQNSNDTGGPTGEYNYLGNLGSARQSRIYFNRRDVSQFLFTDPYDFSVLRPQDVTFYNTLSPYTNISYYKGGGNADGEERFKAAFAINANKRLGVGLFADYIYGRGLYSNQSTALFNGGLYASYRGDKYNLHFIFNTDILKAAENGGITDDRYVTNPLDMAEGKKEYKSYDIPVALKQIWNKNEGLHGFLTHRYNVGFHREVVDSTLKDSVKTREVFVPVTSFIHTVQTDFQGRKYISYDQSQNLSYFRNNYLATDSIDDTHRTAIKNTLAITLHEGFNKWAQAGLTAFASFEYRKFGLVDTIGNAYHRTLTSHNETSLTIGAELFRRQGKVLHYNALGEVALAGEDMGQFTLEGNLDLNIPLWGDTVRLEGNAFVKNEHPVFYYRHFHSKHYWWDNDDLSKTMRTRIEGRLSSGKTKTTLRIGVENIKNYTYLADTSTPIVTGSTTNYRHDAVLQQHDGNIQVFSAILQQRFKLGIFHLDLEGAYQKTSEKDILPLPEVSAYGNAYIKTALAKKVLSVELGADVRYFTAYNAPDYTPVMGQFYVQNPDNAIKLGNYPMVNVYANLHLKRTRFFIMMYHINKGSGNAMSFLAPHYPINPKMIKFGLSWNFFD